MRIIISGGNFSNKGAQAMLYIALNECLLRYPNAEYIAQLPNGFFKVKSLEDLDNLCNGVKSFNDKKNKILKLIEMKKYYRDATAMIDISGYELATKLGFYPCMRYIYKISLSKRYDVKVFLMPQSFGPFSFTGIKGIIINPLIRKYMEYPEICYAREEEGRMMLLEMCKKANVVKASDLVLQNKKIEEYFKKNSNINGENDENKKMVGFVPNSRLYEQCGKELTDSCYFTIMDRLLDKGYEVTLLCHSNGDMKICKSIKEHYLSERNVVLCEKVLSCFEYQHFVKSCAFVVAARYHSIVHAYKECIPAIAMGWAVKYNELLSSLKQDQYVINVKEFRAEDAINMIDNMDNNHLKERNAIKIILDEIQKENCFDVIDGLGE